MAQLQNLCGRAVKHRQHWHAAVICNHYHRSIGAGSQRANARQPVKLAAITVILSLTEMARGLKPPAGPPPKPNTAARTGPHCPKQPATTRRNQYKRRIQMRNPAQVV